MKKSVLILFIIASLTEAYSQKGHSSFGFEANQFIVGSGFGTGTELQVKVSDNQVRWLSVGLYFDSKLNNIGGFSISIQNMLGNHKRSIGRIVAPYLFYNLIYHKTDIEKQMVSDEYFVAIGTYKSIEHHAGIGVRVNVVGSCYLSGEVGYGLYLGSIMKPSKPDPIMNESYGTNGPGALIKIGIGTSF